MKTMINQGPDMTRTKANKRSTPRWNIKK